MKKRKNECDEIKIRAERKGGEMLRGMELNKGAATPSHDVTPLPTLSDLGIARMQSSRWQLEASIEAMMTVKTLDNSSLL